MTRDGWCRRTICWAVLRRKFVATTDSDRNLVVYPNLAPHLELTSLISNGWQTWQTSRTCGCRKRAASRPGRA